MGSSARSASPGPDRPRSASSRTSGFSVHSVRPAAPADEQSPASSITARPVGAGSPGSRSLRGSKQASRQAARR
ncbi:hypothetical protein LUX05_18605 [Streptomyces somaliensis]|nr:hypothetical protein [Streptomyces somaliensis]